MSDCDHFVGFSTVPDCGGVLSQRRLMSGEFANDTRELFAVALNYLKPDARIRPDKSPEMNDEEIVRRYVYLFSYCPTCGAKLPDWLAEHEYRERSRAEAMRLAQIKPPIPQEIEAILDAHGKSAWGKVGWWVFPNGWLPDRAAPCDAWQTNPEAVRAAAINASGTYVA